MALIASTGDERDEVAYPEGGLDIRSMVPARKTAVTPGHDPHFTATI
jgi:hypothetical protein